MVAHNQHDYLAPTVPSLCQDTSILSLLLRGQGQDENQYYDPSPGFPGHRHRLQWV